MPVDLGRRSYFEPVRMATALWGLPRALVDALNAPPLEQLRPPAGAPNVLLIMLDNMGFGVSSAFGGPCRMPVTERLAADGLR